MVRPVRARIRKGLIVYAEGGEVSCAVEKGWIGDGQWNTIACFNISIVPKSRIRFSHYLGTAEIRMMIMGKYYFWSF